MKLVNKKALYNFHILKTIEAGIELTGAEVKSIKAGRIDLSESFARILGGQVYLLNAHIHKDQSIASRDYQPTRSRRLLLHKGEIGSLLGKLSVGKITLLPVSVYEKNNLIKVQLGVARAKKEFDKRKIIKERDQLRQLEQELRGKE